MLRSHFAAKYLKYCDRKLDKTASSFFHRSIVDCSCQQSALHCNDAWYSAECSLHFSEMRDVLRSAAYISVKCIATANCNQMYRNSELQCLTKVVHFSAVKTDSCNMVRVSFYRCFLLRVQWWLLSTLTIVTQNAKWKLFLNEMNSISSDDEMLLTYPTQFWNYEIMEQLIAA